MREIVLDTETTGLDPAAGHRIVEIGCLELLNHVPTGRHFREYLNPEREMPAEAFAIHGLSDAFLADKPLFADIAEPFLEFIGDAKLVIHNAEFDIGFINAELKRLDKPPLARERAIDTVKLARKRFPGAQASLDALCRRFEVDTSQRTLHGALLDCELLAAVYLELRGGRQPGFDLAQQRGRSSALPVAERSRREPRPHSPSATELAAHDSLLEKIDDPIWRR